MGKGSKRRPMQCDRSQFDANWDRVFVPKVSGGKKPAALARKTGERAQAVSDPRIGGWFFGDL